MLEMHRKAGQIEPCRGGLQGRKPGARELADEEQGHMQAIRPHPAPAIGGVLKLRFAGEPGADWLVWPEREEHARRI
jgi:hypothetical protein